MLRPGGRVGLNAFRTADHNPAFAHLINALEKLAGAEAAAFMRTPFVMDSVTGMRALFEQVGFEDIRVVIRIETVRYPSVGHLSECSWFRNAPDSLRHISTIRAWSSRLRILWLLPTGRPSLPRLSLRLIADHQEKHIAIKRRVLIENVNLHLDGIEHFEHLRILCILPSQRRAPITQRAVVRLRPSRLG